MGKKRVLVVYGTRPEAIKMAPIVKAVQASDQLEAITCATAQHRGLLDQVNQFFKITPDYDLNLMQANQDLFHITVNCLTGMKQTILEAKPEVVLVQGDTTTTFAAALAAFYLRVPIGHVEAGLRTWQRFAPYPEEANRCMVGPLADFHFAPTPESLENLRGEKRDPNSLFMTGNTSIDALLWASRQNVYTEKLGSLFEGKKLILMTAHRRENFGTPLQHIFQAVGEFARRHPEYQIVYPVHPNPNVKGPAEEALGKIPNVSLIAPVDYPELVFLLKECALVLTDSGGLQEEAPTLGKPVLVLRETTERPEAVSAGCAKLVGHDVSTILTELDKLVQPESREYARMAQARNPFGDGTAAQQIVTILENRI